VTAAGAVVRLRWLRGMVTTRVMPIREARLMAEDLLHDVIECGDGNAFVTITGYDARTAHIRGRDVITVECVPDVVDSLRPPHVGDDQPPRAAAGTAAGTAAGGTLEYRGAAPGTAWLQRQASHTGSPR
jgi:hypothetical protein